MPVTNPWVIVGALVGAIALSVSSFLYGQEVEANAWKAKLADIQSQAIETYKEDVARMQRASERYARKKEARLVADVAISRALDRAVANNPIYRNDCIDDDGLRAINAALTGKPQGPGEPP